MQVPKPRALPESKKTLKFIPDYYICNICQWNIPVENYLTHLALQHQIKLNKRICVHGPIYNDVVAWKRTGDNCRDHNLLTIMNDGRFPGFKQINNSDNSTDGSRELILSYPNTMYFAHGEDFEESKFNFAMHLASKMGFEYVILLGSDEWVVGDIQKLLDTLDKRMIKLPDWESQAFHVAIDEHQPLNKWNRFITESPKIYYGPGLLRTRFTHWLRYSATQVARKNLGLDFDNENWNEEPLATFQKRICDVVIHHDDSIRGDARNKMMTKFQDKNTERERNRIMHEAFANQHKIKFFMSERKLASWHKSFFLGSDQKYSHFIIHDDSVKLRRSTVEKIQKTIIHNPEIDVISAVYKIDKNHWKVTKSVPEAKFRTPKIQEIYTNCKFTTKQILYALTIDLGPIMCIKRQVIETIPEITNKQEFLDQCLINGFRVFADSSIQISEEKK